MRNVVCGWGGAGAFSDGKLTLTTEYGGNLDDYMSKADLMDKIRYVDDVYCRFGGAGRKVYGDENKECIRDIKRKAAAADLRFIPARIRHLGTDVNAQILTNMRDFLEGKVDIMADTAVDHIVEEKGEIKGVLIGGQFYACRYLVSAPGREGSEWFVHEVEKMGLKLTSNAVDIGVRVEMPAEVLETITDVVYESKLIYFSKSFDDRIRTFCMNPYGSSSKRITTACSRSTATVMLTRRAKTRISPSSYPRNSRNLSMNRSNTGNTLPTWPISSAAASSSSAGRLPRRAAVDTGNASSGAWSGRPCPMRRQGTYRWSCRTVICRISRKCWKPSMP